MKTLRKLDKSIDRLFIAKQYMKEHPSSYIYHSRNEAGLHRLLEFIDILNTKYPQKSGYFQAIDARPSGYTLGFITPDKTYHADYYNFKEEVKLDFDLCQVENEWADSIIDAVVAKYFEEVSRNFVSFTEKSNTIHISLFDLKYDYVKVPEGMTIL